MKNPDNHVSVDIDVIKNAATTIEELEAAGLEPDRVTIQQSDVGTSGELNLAYKLAGEDE
jgi:hypothetical protein